MKSLTEGNEGKGEYGIVHVGSSSLFLSVSTCGFDFFVISCKFSFNLRTTREGLAFDWSIQVMSAMGELL